MHLFPFTSFKFTVAQIIYFILTLLICALCKSLTLGQTHLLSSDRIVFRGEQQALPILWYDLPKMEPESQVSLLSYLLNPPKLNFEHYVQLNHTKELPLSESIAHQPHSDNKIYFISYLPIEWYLRIWLVVECIAITLIILKILQIVHLLIHGSLFASKPSNPSAKLEEECDAVDKKENKESKQKEAALTEVTTVSMINFDKPVKAD